MELAGGQQCPRLHRDANILFNLLHKPSHADGQCHVITRAGDNSKLSSHYPARNDQAMSSLQVSSRPYPRGVSSCPDPRDGNASGFSGAMPLRAEQPLPAMPLDLFIRDSYSELMTGGLAMGAYPEHMVTQLERDIWQDRLRQQQTRQLSTQQHAPQQRQEQQQDNNNRVNLYQQQHQEQQSAPQQRQEQQQDNDNRVHMYQQQHQEQQQRRFHLQYTYANSQRVREVPLSAPPSPASRNQPPISPITTRRCPPVSTGPSLSFPPFIIEGDAGQRVRRRSSSVSSHSSSLSSGHFSTGRSSVSSGMSSRDSTDEVDSGYSSSSSASPCAGATVAEDKYPYVSHIVPANDHIHMVVPDTESEQLSDSPRLYRMLQVVKPDTVSVDLPRGTPRCPGYLPSKDGQWVEQRRHNKRPLQTHPTTEQDVPMDLTCKKPKLNSFFSSQTLQNRDGTTSVSGDTTLHHNHQHRRHLHCQTTKTETKREPWTFIDDYQKAKPNRSCSHSAGSMLKSLLCGASRDTRKSIPDDQALTSEHVATPPPFATGNTRVTIAKKTLLPVSARVSDWLLKIVQFARSLPEYNNLCHNDKVTLLLTAWPRLLLLQMAETNFQFVVTPVIGDTNSGGDGGRGSPSPPAETPTMSAVEKIQAFIRKCQTLSLDCDEYTLLRSATLFSTGYSAGVDDVTYVAEVNSCIRQALQDHIRVSRQGGMWRYSQVLMCLPTLFGLNCKMVENLFCKHITERMDVDVLLKEMLTRTID